MDNLELYLEVPIRDTRLKLLNMKTLNDKYNLTHGSGGLYLLYVMLVVYWNSKTPLTN